jgi:hypothetical protein
MGLAVRYARKSAIICRPPGVRSAAMTFAKPLGKILRVVATLIVVLFGASSGSQSTSLTSGSLLPRRRSWRLTPIRCLTVTTSSSHS